MIVYLYMDEEGQPQVQVIHGNPGDEVNHPAWRNEGLPLKESLVETADDDSTTLYESLLDITTHGLFMHDLAQTAFQLGLWYSNLPKEELALMVMKNHHHK